MERAELKRCNLNDFSWISQICDSQNPAIAGFWEPDFYEEHEKSCKLEGGEFGKMK